MTRVKRGTISNKTRKKVLKQAKGYRFGRSTKEREARTAILHAGNFAFGHRRKKKRVFRALFQNQIGAASRERGVSYSKFIDLLKKKGIELNRKVLSQIAENHPNTFSRIVDQVGK